MAYEEEIPVEETVAEDEPVVDTKRHARWAARIAQTKSKRKELVQEWRDNVDYRRGKSFDTDDDDERLMISADWALTKAKQAQLFSQVPKAIVTAKTDEYKGAVGVFAERLNTNLDDAKVGVAMDECLPDVINAAGVAAVLVSYESKTEMREVPVEDMNTMPPEMQQMPS